MENRIERQDCPPIVTRFQLITWSIPILLAFLTLGFGAYTSLEARVRANEINIETLKTELRVGREAHQKSLDKLIDEVKGMKDVVNGIDKKVSVVEEKYRKQ